MTDTVQPSGRPAEFAALLLTGLDVSAAISRRRKRDQKPDDVGLGLKRILLERIVADDPDPGTFGEWLLDQVLSMPVSGAWRAMAADILDDYCLARTDPAFERWLRECAVA
jgi:hypothetical protein